MQPSITQRQVPHFDAIRNVLLVDDTPSDIALTRRALARAGFTVHLEVLQDRNTILQRIDVQKGQSQALFDLILIDVDMSKVDGYELISAIRNFPPTMQTPLVVISTTKEEEQVLRFYDAGASSFIHKAVDFTEYAQTLYEVCSYWLSKMNPSDKNTRVSP